MSIYLSAPLSSNRKGRFLQSVAGAKPLTEDWRSTPPSSGLLLVQAEELADSDVWQSLYHWAMQSGCAVLVINPQANQLGILQQLPMPLDWQLKSVVESEQGEGITTLLAGETDQAIVGFAGSADRQLHHAGEAIHTRYVRKHSNSGLFAITTLPLWSLSLLDHSEALIAWLTWFLDHAGATETGAELNVEQQDFVPDKQDLVVLLLIYAAQGMTLQTLIEHTAIRMTFNTASLDMVKRGEVLQRHGFINENGVTDTGKACLEASQYWAYAPLLIEQLTTGAL